MMRRSWVISTLVFFTLWIALPSLLNSLNALVTIRVASPDALAWLMGSLVVTTGMIARTTYRRSFRLWTWLFAAAVMVFFWILLPLSALENQNRRTALVSVSSPNLLGLVWFIIALAGTAALIAYFAKRAGIATEANRRRHIILSLVQDHIVEGVALFDRKLNLLWCNSAGQRCLFDGRMLRAEVKRLIQRSAESSRSTSQSLTLSESERVNVQAAPTPDGCISVIARPLQNESDAATLFYERFMRRIVHDMRNPLAAVIAHASNLRALEDGQQTVTDMRATALTIETEAQRLTRLVDSLLFDARLSYVPPASEKLDLLDVIEEVYFQHDERAIREGKIIEIDSSLKVAPLEADRDLLVRAISNLVDNSLKYSAVGASVRISLELSTDQYLLKVSDTGDGIAPEYLPDKIFEALVRGRPHDGGSGLGLSIVKKIVELHHGSISAESIVGKGTTITVWLPT